MWFGEYGKWGKLKHTSGLECIQCNIKKTNLDLFYLLNKQKCFQEY